MRTEVPSTPRSPRSLSLSTSTTVSYTGGRCLVEAGQDVSGTYVEVAKRVTTAEVSKTSTSYEPFLYLSSFHRGPRTSVTTLPTFVGSLRLGRECGSPIRQSERSGVERTGTSPQ